MIMPVILTAVIAALIAFYAGWVIYRSVRRAKNGDGCCGCNKCANPKNGGEPCDRP